jgi:hypothetical protein
MIRSRSGLTRCPTCRAHVRAAETPETTSCPFCSAKGPRGRSALVGAALLALTACGGPAETPADTAPTAGDERPADPPSDEQARNDNQNDGDSPTPPEPPPVAAYGIAPEPQPQPLYGIAP